MEVVGRGKSHLQSAETDVYGEMGYLKKFEKENSVFLRSEVEVGVTHAVGMVLGELVAVHLLDARCLAGPGCAGDGSCVTRSVLDELGPGVVFANEVCGAVLGRRAGRAFTRSRAGADIDVRELVADGLLGVACGEEVVEVEGHCVVVIGDRGGLEWSEEYVTQAND